MGRLEEIKARIQAKKTAANKVNASESLTPDMVKFLDANEDKPGKEVSEEFAKKFKTELSSKILSDWAKSKKENKGEKKDAGKKVVAAETIATAGFAINVTVDSDSENDDIEQEKVTEDMLKIESRAINFLDKKYGTARDEGHDSTDELVGTLFIKDEAALAEIENIAETEPLMTSSGTLSEVDFIDGLNYPGIYNIQIDFFAVEKESEKIEASKKVNADVDAQGTPEVGDAPANDKIDAKPPKAEEAEELNKEVGTENKSVVGDAPESVNPENVTETKTMPDVKLGTGDMSSSVAIVKLQEQLNTLKEESAINDAVIKEVTKILNDSGIKVAALRRVLSVNRVTANEKEKALKVIAMAEKLYNDEIREAILPITANKDDVRRHAEMKSIFAQKLEQAGDALEKVAKGEVEDEKSAITAIHKDIRHEVREWEVFKKIMATHDRVADTVNVVQGLLDAKAIHADAMAMEFDSYYNMESIERKKVSASVKNAVAKAEENFAPLSGDGVIFPGMSAAAKHKSEIDGNSLSDLWESAESETKVKV